MCKLCTNITVFSFITSQLKKMVKLLNILESNRAESVCDYLVNLFYKMCEKNKVLTLYENATNDGERWKIGKFSMLLSLSVCLLVAFVVVRQSLSLNADKIEAILIMTKICHKFESH